MNRVVVLTGGSGFVGRAVARQLVADGHTVRALLRRPDDTLHVSEQRLYDGLQDEKTIRQAMRGADTVIHLAARVHQMREESEDPSVEYHRINVEGTRTLARVAAEEGAREFFFASSVKAVGESNLRPWTEEDIPCPLDPYGRSKLEAERSLAEVASKGHLATTVLRLPLVYGPGVKANMLRLFEMVDKGRPVPVGGIRNARSLIYVGNIASAIARLVGTARGHEIFFVADGEDVSTPDLVRRIGLAMGRTVRMIPVPGRFLRILGRFDVPLASPIARRLAGSLTVDTSRIEARIGPMPFTLDDGLAETARWFQLRRKESD